MTPLARSRDDHGFCGPVAAHRGLRRRRLESGAAATRTGAAIAAGGPGLGCLLRGDVAALIAMTWQSEPAAATWLQAALFGAAALGFGVASLAGSGPVRRPGLPALLHTLMAGAMIWMLTAMPAATGMPPTRPV